jgi:DNA modification methylase
MIQLMQGDCWTVLAALPAESVHLCVTSPLYWGQRSYLPLTHPDKPLEIGQERVHDCLAWTRKGLRWCEVPADEEDGRGERVAVGRRRVLVPDPDAPLVLCGQCYVCHLAEVFRHVQRVLRPEGTLWLNLGDVYAHDRKWGGRTSGTHRTTLHGPSRGLGRGKRTTCLKAKDLCGLSWRVAFTLQADGWWLRTENIWHTPNGFTESVEDRTTRVHEQVFHLTRRARYFYDAFAIAEACTGQATATIRRQPSVAAEDLRRHRRSVWRIPTTPCPEPHYAVMAPAVAEICLRASTSAAGCCPHCQAPWVRVVEKAKGTPTSANSQTFTHGKTVVARQVPAPVGRRARTVAVRTVGWRPSCACPPGALVPCVVLDPFSGAGTTGLVATRLGRSSIGIERNAHDIALRQRRLTAEAPVFHRVTLAHHADAMPDGANGQGPPASPE